MYDVRLKFKEYKMKDIEQAVKPLEDKLQTAMAEVNKIKNAINTYYEAMGEPIKYPDVGQESVQGAAPRPDEYYGKPLATVITEVLQKRKRTGLGSATLDEVFAELVAGGFKFAGKNAGIQKRGLAISMSKNPKFHKLDNETWGLKVWYPTAKDKPAKDNKDIVNETINNDGESEK